MLVMHLPERCMPAIAEEEYVLLLLCIMVYYDFVEYPMFYLSRNIVAVIYPVLTLYIV